jgi:hypothetical protein
MKINIDFSILYSPTGAFGNVTGKLELPAPPKIGDVITLFKDNMTEFGPEFSGSLRVDSITSVHSEIVDTEIFDLEFVVLNSYEKAKKLANRLETECGLFCPEYERSYNEHNLRGD